MENKGLLFIPDISGFTRFITETEIEHSSLIIQELLELLINANQIGLQVSEIEGDAILFYKFGEPPQLAEIYKQVEKMFCEFHQNLIAYSQKRYCQCKACTSAADLTLKVVTHYGEFTEYNVKTFNKLIGKDVIVAHQLLKNDIEQHEYWLVTKNLLQNNIPEDYADWMKWMESFKQTESGEVYFSYTQLGQLKNMLTPDPSPQLNLSNKKKIFSLSKEFETDIITLFHASGDFNYRNRWLEGVQKVEELNHFLPRVGMRYRYTINNKPVVITSSSYYYQPDRIEFSETEANTNKSVYYTLEKTSDTTTKLTLDIYILGNIYSRILFRLTQEKKLKERFQKSMQNLESLVKTLRIQSAVDMKNSVS